MLEEGNLSFRFFETDRTRLARHERMYLRFD